MFWPTVFPDITGIGEELEREFEHFLKGAIFGWSFCQFFFQYQLLIFQCIYLAFIGRDHLGVRGANDPLQKCRYVFLKTFKLLLKPLYSLLAIGCLWELWKACPEPSHFSLGLETPRSITFQSFLQDGRHRLISDKDFPLPVPIFVFETRASKKRPVTLPETCFRTVAGLLSILGSRMRRH